MNTGARKQVLPATGMAESTATEKRQDTATAGPYKSNNGGNKQVMKETRRIFVAPVLLAIMCNLSAGAAPDALSEGLMAELPVFKDYTAARESSYDRTGGNADGRHDWPLEPGETRVMADITGAGAITHIWITIATKDDKHLKHMVLRAYWDGEENPSIEAPIGDFFGLGHGKYYQYSCLPIQIGTDRGLNCFWRMPFSDGARITVTNEGPVAGQAFYYYIDYQKLDEVGGDVGRFHAQYRQAYPCDSPENYVFLDAKGRGHFVGCNLSIHNRAAGWWGEGDDMIYVDGEETPTLHGTGSEDYFCGAWAYGAPFSNLYFGAPLIDGQHAQNALWNVYRYHLEDPIPFTRSIRVTIEHGHKNNRSDDFSSVAYWYQNEPHVPFPPLPAPDARFHTEATTYTEAWAHEAEAIAPLFQDQQVVAEDMARFGNFWSHGKQLAFLAEGPATCKAPLPVEASDAGDYMLELWYTAGPDYGRCELWLNGKKLCQWDGFNHSGVVRKKLQKQVPATLKPGENAIELRVTGKNERSSGFRAGWDCYRANPA